MVFFGSKTDTKGKKDPDNIDQDELLNITAEKSRTKTEGVKDNPVDIHVPDTPVPEGEVKADAPAEKAEMTEDVAAEVQSSADVSSGPDKKPPEKEEDKNPDESSSVVTKPETNDGLSKTTETSSGPEIKSVSPDESVGTAEAVSPDEGAEKRRKKSSGLFKKSSEKKSFFGFLKKGAEKVEFYDFEKDGPLIEPEVPKGYSPVDEYWIQKGRSKVLIVNNDENRLNEYMLFEPFLSEFEHELLERLFEDMRDVLILTDEEIKHDKSHIILNKMSELIKEYKIKPEKSSIFKLQYYLMRNFLGWSKLDPLMNDPFLEDISCDGSEIPVFLYHRKYRNIKTNVSFKEENLYSLAISLAQRSGKHISISQPMLDATLPDGSRLQLTLGKEVTSRGTSFTIRKFREEPFTPVELMEYGTFSAEELVFFWLAIENNKSLLFVGGTASGKTSSLNAVSLFIPPLSKIVSIEDTREITLYHDNWIASVTRESVVESTGSKIDMFDLLKAAMRQRPEYILVGEVRGVEAQTLFQAMNTGHTTFSTLHANNVDAAIHRLENAPLNVPRNMVQALDIVSVQALVYRGQERVRRSMEIVEIVGIDPGTGNLRVNNVFEYDPVSEVHSYSGRSGVYRSIMEIRGWSANEMNLEVERRLKVLEAMHLQEIRDYVSVTRIIQAYSINPDKVMSNIDDLRQVFL